MPRKSLIIALVIIFLGVVFMILGFAGIFPGAGNLDTDFTGQNSEVLVTFNNGQGMMTAYSIQVAMLIPYKWL